MDLVGRRFGRLVVLERAPMVRQYKYRNMYGWICKCDCGEVVEIGQSYLTSGKTKSCGCLRRETARETMLVAREKRWQDHA